MPREFKVRELSSMESIAGWAFYCALAKVENWDESRVANPDGTVTITFRAGETDLDFGVVMERMNEGFKRAVDEKAKALLEERLHDFQSKVYNLCDRIEDCIQDEAAKVFPDFKREDDD